jgi:hypothetical protein
MNRPSKGLLTTDPSRNDPDRAASDRLDRPRSSYADQRRPYSHVPDFPGKDLPAKDHLFTLADHTAADRQFRIPTREDRIFDKKLDHDLRHFDNNVRKLDRYIDKMEAKREKQIRNEERIREKREKDANKERLRQAKRQPKAPRFAAIPGPPRCGSGAVGQCRCIDGTLSDLAGRCGMHPETAMLMCGPGETRDSAGRCTPFQTQMSPFFREDCSRLAAVLTRLEIQRQLMEDIRNEACQHDPAGFRCTQITDEYSGFLRQREVMRARYEACRNSL